MSRRRWTTAACALLCGVLVAGCGGKDDAKGGKDDEPAAEATERVPSVLVVDGVRMDEDGMPAATPAARTAAAAARRKASLKRDLPDAAVDDVEEWPEPPLYTDGTINDGDDPFTGPVQLQPLPIEDDGGTTAEIDAFAQRLKLVEREQWDRWMNAGLDSPWSQDEDPALGSIVKLYVQRCGGARTVATGIVLAEDTVVTTVHAVESPARRVWVAPALGDVDGGRIPAMIRYLDVDDDIAVLKVPGLAVQPMLFHVVTGTEPQWGYAYGVGRGGTRGTVRRTPAVVAMEEASITLEQPDGLAEEITDRSVFPMVGGVDTGYSGGVVMATNDPDFVTGWGFHGLIRARVPFRSDTGGIAVPARLVADALDANDRLEEWYEHRVGRCPQWHR